MIDSEPTHNVTIPIDTSDVALAPRSARLAGLELGVAGFLISFWTLAIPYMISTNASCKVPYGSKLITLLSLDGGSDLSLS